MHLVHDTFPNGAGTLVSGEIARLTAAGLVLAQADSLPNTAGVVGVVMSGSVAATGPASVVITHGHASMLLESGLTLVVGDTLWLSATVAGRATNVKPTIAFPIGTLKSFDAAAYAATGFVSADVLTLDTVEQAARAAASAAASSEFGMFFGLTAGTGNGGPTDYAATVAVKTSAGTGRVPFPRNGPAVGIVRNDPNSVTLPEVGTYEVSFEVHTTEPGQLQLEANGVDLAETCVGNMNPTSGGHPLIGHAFITTATPNVVIAVVNPAGNAAALTITPADGSETHANAQTLTVKRLA
jgi:hypothetical protein